jgi:hypothetical protein
LVKMSIADIRWLRSYDDGSFERPSTLLRGAMARRTVRRDSCVWLTKHVLLVCLNKSIYMDD